MKLIQQKKKTNNFFSYITKANFILPWSKIYWFSWALFFINGCGAAIFEVGSSQMMLRLWHGISSSPISSTYGSYGIGAIIAAQLAKPFIKFNPIENVENKTANVTENSTILPSDIQLQIPYGCGTILAAIVTVGLFISQYYELIELKKFKEYRQKMKLIVSTEETSVKPIKNTTDAIYCMRVQKMFFQNVVYKNKAVFIMFFQILLLCIIFMSVYAFLILNNFLLTFFTKGPAKLEIGLYINIYSLFWFFFIFGRLLSVFVAFKMNAFLFYGLIVVSSFVSVGLFILPFFNSKTIPIYFILATIGLVNGPLQPSGFMIATALLGNVKSIVIALFCTSFNLGAIFSQISAGYIFDNFKPDPDWFLYTDATSVYILPFLLFFYVALNLVVFFISFMIFKFSSKYVQNNTKQITNE